MLCVFLGGCSDTDLELLLKSWIIGIKGVCWSADISSFGLFWRSSFLHFKKRCSWFPTEKKTQHETHEKQKRKKTSTVTVYPAASSCCKTRSYFLPKKINFHKAFPVFSTKLLATSYHSHDSPVVVSGWLWSMLQDAWNRGWHRWQDACLGGFVTWCGEYASLGTKRRRGGKRGWKGRGFGRVKFWVPRVYTCFVDVLVVFDPCISINKYHIQYTYENVVGVFLD